MNLDLSLLKQNERYVIGVSGGPDSMALLDQLYHEGFNLVVCLVNYHVRMDSDQDYEVVFRYCKKHGILLEYKENFHYEPGNFEAQARKIRYDFYVDAACKHHCSAVILAHHRDDFLETVLMQQARGMHDVYFGIREISEYHQLKVIRPAMACYKQELLDYCEQHQITYCIDSTNLSDAYTRNYFRHQILSGYTPAMKTALYDWAMAQNQQLAKKTAYCKDWLSRFERKGQLPVKALLQEAEAAFLLRTYLSGIKGLDPAKISAALIQNCLQALASSQPNVKINLPVNFVLIKEYDNMYVTKIEKEVSYQFTVTEGLFGDFGFFKIADQGDDREGLALSAEDFPLTIRSWQAGDSIELSYGKKKLSRLFIDAKIPSLQRAGWPVVLNSRQEIILVPKIAKNKHYLLAKPTWFVIQ